MTIKRHFPLVIELAFDQGVWTEEAINDHGWFDQDDLRRIEGTIHDLYPRGNVTATAAGPPPPTVGYDELVRRMRTQLTELRRLHTPRREGAFCADHSYPETAPCQVMRLIDDAALLLDEAEWLIGEVDR